jgi:hypothetical protein
MAMFSRYRYKLLCFFLMNLCTVLAFAGRHSVANKPKILRETPYSYGRSKLFSACMAYPRCEEELYDIAHRQKFRSTVNPRQKTRFEKSKVAPHIGILPAAAWDYCQNKVKCESVNQISQCIYYCDQQHSEFRFGFRYRGFHCGLSHERERELKKDFPEKSIPQFKHDCDQASVKNYSKDHDTRDIRIFSECLDKAKGGLGLSYLLEDGAVSKQEVLCYIKKNRFSHLRDFINQLTYRKYIKQKLIKPGKDMCLQYYWRQLY